MKANYTVKHRRKREGRTNYKKRLSLLKSRKERVVIRKTNTQLIIQVVKYQDDGDKVLMTYKSSNLKKLGWNHSFKNLPGAYLAGLQAGLQAKKLVKEAIPDFGLQTAHKGGKLYAALNGLLDAGLNVHANKEVFPSEERLTGKHVDEKLVKDFEKIKEKLLK